ncbi:MAG: hypothetical protein HUU21_01715 [Polyangiaceae bacterium]|nr:hypothetical protein [Polyangiaceae bacterium]
MRVQNMKLVVALLALLDFDFGLSEVNGLPAGATFGEIGVEMGALMREEEAHYRDIGRAPDAADIAKLEDSHLTSVDARIERMARVLSWIELCSEEGEARETPWLSELLGRAKEEARGHAARMRSLSDVTAATREEARHQEAMERLLSDLAKHGDEAQVDERRRTSKLGRCLEQRGWDRGSGEQANP